MSCDPSSADITRAVLTDVFVAFAVLLTPTVYAYLSLYALAKRWTWVFRLATVVAIFWFWMATTHVLIRCAAVTFVFRAAVGAATMKLLDLNVLHHTGRLPTYTASSKPPPPSLLALYLLTELRYESFTPNPIRQPPAILSSPTYSEPLHLLLTTLLFLNLHLLPQPLPIKSLNILLLVNISWTAMQRLLRYRTSPPLFGPLYAAESLGRFWTETWHNAFSSPCYNLAYRPVHFALLRLGLPRGVARGGGVLAGFALMGVYHAWVGAPYLTERGCARVFWFFVLSGVGVVLEGVVWGKGEGGVKRGVAWFWQWGVACWCVEEVGFREDVVFGGRWWGFCRPECVGGMGGE